MIAKAFLVSNIDEINEARMRIEKLALDTVIPKPTFVERDFCFALADIVFAFLNDDGNIKTIIRGQEVILKFDEQVYNRIKEHFKNI